MMEGSFDVPAPRKGPSVEVVGAEQLYALTIDPFAEKGGSVVVQSDVTPEDPLFKTMETEIIFSPDKSTVFFGTDLAFNEKKLNQDRGFSPKTKRDSMLTNLRKAGYRRLGILFGGAERFVKAGISGHIDIDYGPPTPEQYEAELDAAYQDMARDPNMPYTMEHAESDLDNALADPVVNPAIRINFFSQLAESKDAFVAQFEGYGSIYSDILKALYETEGVEPPNSHIVLAPPHSKGINE